MAVPFTPETCARAIVAAARSYGDDPVAAIGPVQHRGGKNRRSLIPAALAIINATGCARTVICSILAVDYHSLSAVPKKPVSAAAWRAALMELGGDPAAVYRSRFGPKPKTESLPVPAPTATPSEDEEAAEPRRTRPVPPRRVGTVVAPPPSPLEAPSAPEPASPRVDHRAAIAEAMARRAAHAVTPPAPAPRGCHWAIRPGAAMDDATCTEEPVEGRLFCAPHCRAVGQKDTPVILSTPDMPQRFAERQGAS